MTIVTQISFSLSYPLFAVLSILQWNPIYGIIVEHHRTTTKHIIRLAIELIIQRRRNAIR